MAEIDDMIKNLLSSPEGLNSIMNLIKGLSANSRESQTPSPSAPGEETGPSLASGTSSDPTDHTSDLPLPQPQAGSSSAAVPALSSFPDLSALSKVDPRYISAVMSVLGEYSSDDERIHLLTALKPHLKSERRQRVDKAAQILRITKSIRAALKGLPGGDKHV